MMSKFFIIIIAIYQRGVSPFTRPCCRYSPTCSEYVKLHIEKHGIIKSLLPSIRRILSCRPFSKKPIWDPVK